MDTPYVYWTAFGYLRNLRKAVFEIWSLHFSNFRFPIVRYSYFDSISSRSRKGPGGRHRWLRATTVRRPLSVNSIGGSGSEREARKDQRRRQFASALGALRRKAFPQESSDGSYQAIEDVGASGNYGLSDFRAIDSWRFFARPFLKPEEKAKISIGVLHVKVVEARGLLAANMGGKSDPYVKLTLTGRYLSNSQEWSESLRIKEQTRYIRNTLDPAWNEDFSLPVRRAGAVLKVEVWDRDFASADDELGDFEIQIGEELLSQKPTDMWYVVEVPRGMELATAAIAKAKRYKKPDPTEQDAPSTATVSAASPAEFHEQAGDDDAGKEDEDGSGITVQPQEREQETGNATDVDFEGTANDQDRDADSFPPIQSTAEGRLGYYAGVFKTPIRSMASLDRSNHANTLSERCHESADEARSFEECIERRRRTVGEVRLQLRFEFDEFAETCSHLWPEEPELPPPGPAFSPNRLYYKAMLLLELARPHLGFMLEANAVVTWVRPWRSLFWLIFLSIILIFPSVFIVVFNGVLMLVTIAGYLSQTFGDVGEGGTVDSSAGSLEEGKMQSGLRRASSSFSTTAEPNSGSKKGAKNPALRADILDPEYAAGDAEMGEVYKKVASAKKLPIVVEETGRHFFSVNGSVMQRQVDLMTVTLMKMRRRFRPLDRGGLLRMMVYLTLNTLLQLWLYISGRFNLYLLFLCVGVFSYYFYYRRGKAFIMAIKEASRTRKVRLAYSVENPAPDSSSSTAPGPVLSSAVSPSILWETDIAGRGAGQKRYPAFAPSGATPVDDSSIPSASRTLPSDLLYQHGEHGGGHSMTAASSGSSGVMGFFRKGLLPRGDWFTPGPRRRASDTSGSPLAEGGPTSTFFPPPTEQSNEGDHIAKDVLLRQPQVGSEDAKGEGSYTARTDVTTFDTGHDGSVQQSQLSRVLKMPKWGTPWRRGAGKDDSENTALVDNQGSAEAGRAWAPKLSKWSSE